MLLSSDTRLGIEHPLRVLSKQLIAPRLIRQSIFQSNSNNYFTHPYYSSQDDLIRNSHKATVKVYLEKRFYKIHQESDQPTSTRHEQIKRKPTTSQKTICLTMHRAIAFSQHPWTQDWINCHHLTYMPPCKIEYPATQYLFKCPSIITRVVLLDL